MNELNAMAHGIGEIVAHTPLWVWAVLVFLVRRSWKRRVDYPFDLARACIVPAIFILWGLESVFGGFTDIVWTLGCYVAAAATGGFAGYVLYASRRRLYLREGVWYATGSYLPLCIALANFVVKYVLHVYMSVQPLSQASLGFETVYGLAAGLALGLFIGGITQAVVAQGTRPQREG